MKKYLLSLLAILGIALVVLFSLSSTKKGGQTTPPAESIIPTTIPFVNTNGEQTTIKTVPDNNEVNVPLNQSISLSFSTTVSLPQVTFSFSPNLIYTINQQGSTLSLTPSYPLKANTKYTYTIFYLGKNVAQRSFTTLSQPTQNPSSTQLYDPAKELNDITTKQGAPDIYLANRLPTQTDTFGAYSTYTSSPAGHYYISVVLFKSPDIGKSDFKTWVLSQGLTEAQYNSLDIRFSEGGPAEPNP